MLSHIALINDAKCKENSIRTVNEEISVCKCAGITLFGRSKTNIIVLHLEQEYHMIVLN